VAPAQHYERVINRGILGAPECQLGLEGEEVINLLDHASRQFSVSHPIRRPTYTIAIIRNNDNLREGIFVYIGTL
jgi:hypothetical protein